MNAKNKISNNTNNKIVAQKNLANSSSVSSEPTTQPVVKQLVLPKAPQTYIFNRTVNFPALSNEMFDRVADFSSLSTLINLRSTCKDLYDITYKLVDKLKNDPIILGEVLQFPKLAVFDRLFAALYNITNPKLCVRALHTNPKLYASALNTIHVFNTVPFQHLLDNKSGLSLQSPRFISLKNHYSNKIQQIKTDATAFKERVKQTTSLAAGFLVAACYCKIAFELSYLLLESQPIPDNAKMPLHCIHYLHEMLSYIFTFLNAFAIIAFSAIFDAIFDLEQTQFWQGFNTSMLLIPLVSCVFDEVNYSKNLVKNACHY